MYELQRRLMSFLGMNPTWAFTVAEITSALEEDMRSIYGAIRSLEEEGKIKVKRIKVDKKKKRGMMYVSIRQEKQEEEERKPAKEDGEAGLYDK